MLHMWVLLLFFFPAVAIAGLDTRMRRRHLQVRLDVRGCRFCCRSVWRSVVGQDFRVRSHAAD